jgi:hypothetical protein
LIRDAAAVPANRRSATVASEKQRTHVNVKTLSLAIGDIGYFLGLRETMLANP